MKARAGSVGRSEPNAFIRCRVGADSRALFVGCLPLLAPFSERLLPGGSPCWGCFDCLSMAQGPGLLLQQPRGLVSSRLFRDRLPLQRQQQQENNGGGVGPRERWHTRPKPDTTTQTPSWGSPSSPQTTPSTSPSLTAPSSPCSASLPARLCNCVCFVVGVGVQARFSVAHPQAPFCSLRRQSYAHRRADGRLIALRKDQIKYRANILKFREREGEREGGRGAERERE